MYKVLDILISLCQVPLICCQLHCQLHLAHVHACDKCVFVRLLVVPLRPADVLCDSLECTADDYTNGKACCPGHMATAAVRCQRNLGCDLVVGNQKCQIGAMAFSISNCEATIGYQDLANSAETGCATMDCSPDDFDIGGACCPGSSTHLTNAQLTCAWLVCLLPIARPEFTASQKTMKCMTALTPREHMFGDI